MAISRRNASGRVEFKYGTALDDTLNCQGVCKDCGNGTLNNRLNEAFDYNGGGVYCLNCGSTR
jgi:hypothetical protein